MVQDTTQEILKRSLNQLGNLGEFAIYFAVYALVAKLISSFINARIRNRRFLLKYGRDGEMIVCRAVSITAYVIAGIAAVSHMGVNSTGLLTLLSAFTVSIGLSLQEVLKNMFSGLFMLAERPFSIGDRVKVRDRVGTVQGIDIRTTMLKTEEGSMLLVPNIVMFTEILQNDSRYNSQHVKLQIATTMPHKELDKRLRTAMASIEGLRLPLESPRLVQRDGDRITWQVGFSYDSAVVNDEAVIVNQVLEAFPDSSITKVY